MNELLIQLLVPRRKAVNIESTLLVGIASTFASITGVKPRTVQSEGARVAQDGTIQSIEITALQSTLAESMGPIYAKTDPGDRIAAQGTGVMAAADPDMIEIRATQGSFQLGPFSLEEFDLEVAAVVGDNGAGKSTLRFSRQAERWWTEKRVVPV